MQIKSRNNQKIGLVIVSIILFILISPKIPSLIRRGVSYFWIGLIAIFFIIGFGVGKYFPKVSWKVLLLPTIPWIIFCWTSFTGSNTVNAPLALGFGVIGLILYFPVFMGNYVGIWVAKRKDATTKIIISE